MLLLKQKKNDTNEIFSVDDYLHLYEIWHIETCVVMYYLPKMMLVI